MATALDIITTAMRRIGVTPAEQAPSAAEAISGLEVLNDMVASWNAKNVNTGLSTLALTDDFALEDRHLDGVKSMLAVRLADDYGSQVSNSLQIRAKEGWRLIQADYHYPELLRVDDAFLVMPMQRLFR